MSSAHYVSYPIKTWDSFETQRGSLSKEKAGEAASFTELPTSVCPRCNPADECFLRMFLLAGKIEWSSRGQENHTHSHLCRHARRAQETWHGPSLTRRISRYNLRRLRKSAAPCHHTPPKLKCSPKKKKYKQTNEEKHNISELTEEILTKIHLNWLRLFFSTWQYGNLRMKLSWGIEKNNFIYIVVIYCITYLFVWLLK